MKKKALIGVIAGVVVAAAVGFATYEIVANKNTTSTQTSSSSNLENTSVKSDKRQENETISSTTKSSESIANITDSSNKKDIVHNNTNNASAKIIIANVKDSGNKNSSQESSKTKDDTLQNSTSSNTTVSTSNTENNSNNSSKSSKISVVNKTNTKDENNNSNSNIIDGEPVLFNNNSQVSAYYGTWIVGEKIGEARIGTGQKNSSIVGESVILTKSLYSFDGVTIENPNYYIISTSAKSYFGSSGWNGDVGASSNGIISFVVAAPSNVKVTANTIYKYEGQSKIIINDGSLAVLNYNGTVYSVK